MTFDPLNDLIPVGPVGTVPLFLVINSKVPAKTLAEFIAYAKANPDKVSYAAAGAGTTPDLTGGEFARRAGLDKLVFVPFRGTAPATMAVIGGDVQLTFVSMGSHIEFIRNGALRVLAAATPQRRPYALDVPTFAEAGFPEFRNVDLVFDVRTEGHADEDRQPAQCAIPARSSRTPKPESGWTQASSIP